MENSILGKYVSKSPKNIFKGVLDIFRNSQLP